MFNDDQIAYHKRELTKLVDQFDQKPNQIIEFGNRRFNSKNFFTRIRVRVMPTAGGLQFGIHLVSNMRGESCGMYFPLTQRGKEEMINQCIAWAVDYVKPIANERAVAKRQEEDKSGPEYLSFYAMPNASHIEITPVQKINERLEASGEGFHFPGEVTITLG